MRARFKYVRDLITNSYWFVPALITLGAIVLSVVTQMIDSYYALEGLEEVAWLRAWIFAGGADGAREVLSTIAGSMITVAGVVFSITIVALTLASSQFGPRVLSSFMRDDGNKLVLGIFIATFVYSLLVLRTIRSGGENSDAVVPHVSVTVALVLSLASLSVLIYFIHHVATSIQAPHLIAAIAQELHGGISGLIPDDAKPPQAGENRSPSELLPDDFEERAGRVHSEETGYVEAIDIRGLVELAGERGLVLQLVYRPGHFVVKGCELARVWPPESLDREVSEQITRGVVIGRRRTALQDVEFPINQLVEVSVRALSPSTNDPFTAINCVDQLAAGLCELAPRPFPPACWFGADGELRLVMTKPITFPGVVGAAFDQIRQNAGYHTAVHIRLLDAIERVIACASSVERLEPLLRQADLILERSEAEVSSGADRADVRARYQKVRAAADRKRAALENLVR